MGRRNNEKDAVSSFRSDLSQDVPDNKEGVFSMLNKICDLNLGSSDAQNYGQKSNREMFNEIFVKNIFLENMLEHQRYFLIGEKGTGKTAYATYLSNNDYNANFPHP